MGAAHRARVIAQQLSDEGRGPAMERQQDHQHPGGDPPGAVQQPEELGAGVVGGVGVDGDRAQDWKQPRVVALVGDPRGYFFAGVVSPPVTDRTSGQMLRAMQGLPGG
jgi:hypothetical protein